MDPTIQHIQSSQFLAVVSIIIGCLIACWVLVFILDMLTLWVEAPKRLWRRLAFMFECSLIGKILIFIWELLFPPEYDYYNKYTGVYDPKPASNITLPPSVPKKSFFDSPLIKKTKPPSAKSFGRIDGELIDTQGKLEEKYLNSFEIKKWKAQKLREEVIASGILDKTVKKDLIEDVFTAKSFIKD